MKKKSTDIMEISHIFKINDWTIRKFIVLVFSLEMAFLGSIALDLLGISIPFLRPLLGFLILTFIPGFLILRILRIHNLETIPTVLYGIGISLAIIMFCGFFFNLLYPLIGITNPITVISLICTMTLGILILCTIAYFLDRSFLNSIKINFKGIISPAFVFFSILPFLAFFGTYMMNFYHSNFVLLGLILVISLIPFLLLLEGLIDPKIYPFAIWTTSFSILLHVSLISMYVVGSDIQLEIHLSDSIIRNGIWDPSIFDNLNSVLSLTMLAPIYSILLSIKLEWIFKIFYPFLFSLVPVGLFHVFRKQTSDKIAFLACFFFISLFTFYLEMIALARQEIAELFVVLLMLLLLESTLNKIQKALLFFLFSLSLIVSHYGLSYLIWISLIFVWIFIELSNLIKSSLLKISNNQRSLWTRFFNIILQEGKNKNIPMIFIVWYSVMCLIWSIYISSSSSFKTFIETGNRIVSNVVTDSLNPNSAEGLQVILTNTITPLHTISKYVHFLMIFFIVVGFFVVYFTREKLHFNKKYIIFSLFALILCISGIALPFVASSWNTTRLYQISLIFLAPFCVIGGIFSLNWIFHQKNKWELKYTKLNFPLIIFSALLMIFLLFNSGWLYTISHDSDVYISFNSTVNGPLFNEMEYTGALWIEKVSDGRSISADDYRQLLMLSIFGKEDYRKESKKTIRVLESTSNSSDTGYTFIGSDNIRSGSFTNRTNQVVLFLDPFEQHLNIIYDAGGSRVLINK